MEPQLPRRLRPLRPAARARRLRALHPSRRDGPASGWRTPAPRCRSARRRTCFSAAGCSTCGPRMRRRARGSRHRRRRRHEPFACCARWTSRTRSASWPANRCLRCRRSISRRWAARPRCISTTASATSTIGKEADFVVLDPEATPHLARRMERTHDARRAAVRVHDHGRRPRGARDARAGRAGACSRGLTEPISAALAWNERCSHAMPTCSSRWTMPGARSAMARCSFAATGSRASARRAICRPRPIP